LSPEEFVAELDKNNDAALGKISARAAAPLEGDKDPLSIIALLKLALKNELEATECAASWIPTTDNVRVKLALARQAGDEAKHFNLIKARLKVLGCDVSNIESTITGRSPLLGYLMGITDTVARVAAGQFTREALAMVRNRAFIDFCKAKEDLGTAALYEDTIQPDERHHHELGRTLLLTLATTDDAQQSARESSARVLALADELGEILRLKLGAQAAPGC